MAVKIPELTCPPFHSNQVDTSKSRNTLPFINSPFARKAPSIEEVFFQKEESINEHGSQFDSNIASHNWPKFSKQNFDFLEAIEIERENSLRALASEVADELPTDDDSWASFNCIRHKLIEKELSVKLTQSDQILLGTLERLSDRRIREQNFLSMNKAEELLAKLQESESEH